MANSNITYRRPGVYASEVLVTQQPGSGSGNEFASVIVGQNDRGPTSPIYVRSWTEYVQNFGGFGANQLPMNVFFYFANGGSGCYVQRIAGTGAAKATRTLTDGAGTPLSTLKVDAINEGIWGNQIYIQVTRKAFPASGAFNGQFSIVVYYGSNDAASVVERWDDLSMTNSDARYAPNIINAQTGGNVGSNYITVTDLNSATTVPNDAPATSAVGALAGGANGSAPGTTDWDAVFADDGMLNQIDQPLQVNVAGQYATSDYTTINKALTWAANRGDAWVVADVASGQTPSQAITQAGQLNGAAPTGGYGAVYYPWVLVADPSAVGPGVTRFIPPGPCILGLAERTDISRGVFKAPAGLNARVLGALGLERKLSSLDLDNLNTAVPAVNALRAIPGGGICVMGARTLTTGSADKYIPNRRSLIYLKAVLKQITAFAIFEPNDFTLWSQVENVCTRFLTGYWQSGGLVGLKPSDAFFVNCDETLNTYAVTQAGEVRVEVGVALTNPAEFVVIRIGQTVAGASTSEAA